MDEDDLTALRSAALASRSSKDIKTITAPGAVESRDEEDLDALRKAALMTRKQRQIQVIHRKIETHQRPSIPLPLPIAPSLKNIPPPPLLIPPPLHSISVPPPPIFSHPIIVGTASPVWATNNLISLTPGLPGPRPPNFLPPNPLRPIIARVPQLPVHKVFPRVITVTNARNNVNKPVIKTSEVPVSYEMEQKVPDKFSRYDPDSSSEDEEEHSAKKKDGDVSDVESVVSKKSFTSESDTNDNLEASTIVNEINVNDDKEHSKQDEDVKSDPGTPLQDEPCDDDISIIGDDEDDDILAAIDDFLEDRPEKTEPKKVVRKNSNKREKPKVKPTPVVFEKSSIPKQMIPKESRSGDSQSVSSKMKEKKSAEVKQSDKPIESDVQPVATIKIPAQGRRGNPSQRNKDNSRKQTRTTAPVPDVKLDEAYQIPVVSKKMAPSPRRQRRESDLDSVGTSDLSFLSSDEGDKKTEQKKEPRKRPRTRSVSDEMEKRRNERMKKESSPPDVPLKKISNSQSSVKHQASEYQLERDLRRKLESKGVKRAKIEPDCQGTESVKEPKSRLDSKGNLKRGVISLKPKSSNSSSQSAKLSRKDGDRKIVVTARTERKAKAVRTDMQRNKDSPTVTVKTRQRDIARGQITKRTKFSELSPIVAPSDVKVVVQPVPRKTVRLCSDEKPVLHKPSKKSTGKTDDQPRKETFNGKESSASEEGSESDDDLFHEEEIFSFANQDIADYDDVLGDMTEEVEITPKVRRKFSYNARKGKKYDTVDASSMAKSTGDNVGKKRETRARIEGAKDEEKRTIHYRLGRQLDDTDLHEPTESDPGMFAGNKRRVLVSRTSSSPEDSRLSSKVGSVKDRLGKTVKLSKTDQNTALKRSVMKSHRSAKVSLKMIPKKSPSSPNKESVLEKKIRRIKQQNGKILKRQMEIQREKEKFG